MKKLLGIVLVAALFTGIAPVAANAKVAQGQACSKVGARSVVGLKTFVCVKKGSKKIWNLVKVSQPNSTPTPSQTPSATPKAFCADASTVVGDITKYDYCAVFSSAKKALTDRLTSLPTQTPPLEFLADPKISADWLALEKARVTVAYNFWYPDFKPEKFTELYWLMDTKEQVAWANAIWQPREGHTNGNAPIEHLDPNNCEAADSADFANIDFTTRTYISHGYITNTCAGETTPDKAFKVIHEYTHLVQFSMHMPQNAPSWMTEGGADYFGEILGNAQISEAVLDAHHKSFTLWAKASSLSESEWIQAAKDMESPSADPHTAYYYGSLMTELLIGVYGLDKYIALMKSYLAAPDVNMGPERVDKSFLGIQFQKVYGISIDEFYKDAYPYIHEMGKLYEQL